MQFSSEHAKPLYDLAVNSQTSGNLVHAVGVLRILVEINEPFYTPFALALISDCYNSLGRPDLQLEVYKNVMKLTEEQQRLLNPVWLALCYQRSGDLAGAERIQLWILSLSPGDVNVAAGLAEVLLLQGKLDEAEKWAVQIRGDAQLRFQLLGRLFLAFSLALSDRQDAAEAELRWIGQFFISNNTMPAGTWDYRDIEPLIPKLGANSARAAMLVEALSGKSTLPQFIDGWNGIASAA
jgi:tetratricopeptide (TPR) repeat protein